LACRDELQRITVSEPMSLTPYDGIAAPHPHAANGEAIQVNVFHDECGHIIERWLLSETDVRYYRLEKWDSKWVSVKVPTRKPVS
jgi:hypothetical protein